MLHFEDKAVRGLLFKGNIGLEKEALRITDTGSFAKTAHPFPDDKNIVRDFCENQLEINTGISPNAREAIAELSMYEKKVREKLYGLENREYLWPFSNPPRIEDEEDIPIANFTGSQHSKTVYRKHLARVYGKYKMTFSGIHVNYSFAEELFKEDYACAVKEQFQMGKLESSTGRVEKDYQEYKDRLYLDLASNLMENGWIITALLAASPLVDGSFLCREETGRTGFLGMASVRCSELGYWNHFVPVFDYGSLAGYAAGIMRYIKKGFIVNQSELYYPVRLKSRGVNDLDVLVKEGVDHLELRNIDVNPYSFAGIDVMDLEFIKLLIIYDACIEPVEMTEEQQVRAVMNYKNAARYDIDRANILQGDNQVSFVREAALYLLNDMEAFFGNISPEYMEILSFQKDKLEGGKRYAQRVRGDFQDDFFSKGLAYVKEGKHDIS